MPDGNDSRWTNGGGSVPPPATEPLDVEVPLPESTAYPRFVEGGDAEPQSGRFDPAPSASHEEQLPDGDTSVDAVDPSDGPAWVAMPATESDGGDAQTAESNADRDTHAPWASDTFRTDLLAEVRELRATIAQAVALQQNQATMIQRLHAENQQLRQGELTQALKPFILDVARLHDDVAGVIVRGGTELVKAASIPDFILDVLDRHGVTQIAPAAGDPFDAKLHQGLKVTQTQDPALDSRIDSLIRAGFIRDGSHLVRPAQVVVYRHVPHQDLAESGPAGPGPSAGDQPSDVPVAEATATITDQARSNDVG